MEVFHGKDADLIMMLLPDEHIADVYRADPDLPMGVPKSPGGN